MNTHDVQLDQIAQKPLWFDGSLDAEHRARLHAALDARARQFAPGASIERETDLSDAVYVVMDGWTILTKSMPEGQTQIIDFGLPGDFYDLTAADGKTAAISLEAVTATRVAIVPITEWLALCAQMPEVGLITAKTEAAIRSRIAERMLRLGRCTAEERLAYAMLELGVRTGSLLEDPSACFHLPITQQQLGDFMGLTSVHVCRTLRRLTRQEIIGMHDHINLCALDIEALTALAGISIEDLAREILPPV